MNFNTQHFYVVPDRLHQPTGAHEVLLVTAQPDKMEAYFDPNFGLSASGIDLRFELSNVRPSHRLQSSLFRHRAVVRGGLSLGLVFGLLCIGAICFLCMVGPRGIHVEPSGIDKGRLSDNRSFHLLRNVP
jgi:hypothetical protein